MSEGQDRFEEMISNLERVRDELALKAKLGQADAKDEWARLEAEWKAVQHKFERVGGVAGETARNVGAALELAADELKAGYERFRGLI